ncbi:MAG: hypothetical protein ABSB95_14295 [Dissulfurispiraceae bacterium]
MPAPAPQQISGTVVQAEDAQRQRQRAAAANTLLTGAQGVILPQLGAKSLLGS